MLKNWKDLFIKSEQTSSEVIDAPGNLFFSSNNHADSKIINEQVTGKAPNDPVVDEVLQVYENGLDSINMPGYDFYEFYKSISSISIANEQTYMMAYQMAKTLDKTISPQKLTNDAEFYISKISEVHGQYVTQGQQKLNRINEEKTAEKSKLTSEIEQATLRMSQLRNEVQQLESEINKKRGILSKIDENIYPKEKSIKEKLNANDLARRTSIDKLNSIKEGIQRYIKY
jgi:hypothetical protein